MIHKSKPPLRWFANWCSRLQGFALNKTLRKANKKSQNQGPYINLLFKVSDVSSKIYMRWGSFYPYFCSQSYKIDFSEKVDREEF